jgi:hypothetical protein
MYMTASLWMRILLAYCVSRAQGQMLLLPVWLTGAAGRTREARGAQRHRCFHVRNGNSRGAPHGRGRLTTRPE